MSDAGCIQYITIISSLPITPPSSVIFNVYILTMLCSLTVSCLYVQCGRKPSNVLRVHTDVEPSSSSVEIHARRSRDTVKHIRDGPKTLMENKKVH